MTRVAPADSPVARVSTMPVALFAGGGLAAVLLYVTSGAAAVQSAAFLAIGLAAAVALFVGMIRNQARPRWPWVCLSVSAVAFVIGAAIRDWSQRQTGPLQFLADSFTIPGYALMFVALLGFLRARKGAKRHALLDGLLVGVSAGMVFALLFSVPAASFPGRSAAVSALAGCYPIFDTVLVLLMLELAFTTAKRGPSYLMLVACMVCLLAGDTVYAVIGATGALTGPRLIDAPFLLGFTLIGAAALHPSMADLGRDALLPLQAWSLRRLLLITPALAVPFILTAVIARPTLLDRMVVAAGGVVVVALLLVRAASAVQAYAAGQRRYEYQATHDPLTDLPNRSLLSSQVRAMLTQSAPADRPVWLYFLDLDGFKLVNDSRGHDAGDRVIVEAARRLRQAVPGMAAIGRVGGDEFVVAYRANREEAVELAEEILRAMRQAPHMTTFDVVISASIGIANSAGVAAPVTAEEMLRDADTAMYQAKSAGRDRWVIFDPSMHDKVRERIDIDLALRQALVAGQLSLAYQPIVHVATGRLAGVEALIRWNHPERGPLAPASFIPVAEETGLIFEIGRWVMRESLRQLAQWRTEGVVGEDFYMSINVSPRQLRDHRLHDAVAASLADHGVPGSAVMIELTESVMIDNSGAADEILAGLRGLDIRLVVDDFGTGFSALGYLRKYPVTGVKIDQSFVGGLGTVPDDEEIVRAVVAMSTALRLSVVAEGVENEAQLQVLRTLGVQYGQGWLWGRPTDAQTFARQWSPAQLADR